MYPGFAEKFNIPKNEVKPVKQNLDILEGNDKEFLRGAEIAYEAS